jgi:hypothetical protein
MLVTIVAVPPGVLMPPAVVVAIVKALVGLDDDAPWRQQREPQQHEYRPGNGSRNGHEFLRPQYGWARKKAVSEAAVPGHC